MKPELTEERLEYLAEQFRRRRIRELTKATFGDYVDGPEFFDNVAEHIANGGGVSYSPTRPGFVFLCGAGPRPAMVQMPTLPRCMS